MTAYDVLAHVVWECSALPVNAVGNPAELEDLTARGGVTWMPASVPGTAADALVRAGAPIEAVASRNFDGEDWWFRTGFTEALELGSYILRLEGLATIAEVWADDELVSTSASMFERREVDLKTPPRALCVCFRALEPLLVSRRPRPRWKTPRVPNLGLRWFRTSLTGRLRGGVDTPAIIGPWKPITLHKRRAVELESIVLNSEMDADVGVVRVEGVLRSIDGAPEGCVLDVGETRVSAATVAVGDGGHRFKAEVRIAGVARWWPNGYGAQRCYQVRLVCSAAEAEMVLFERTIGFRTVRQASAEDGFRLVVNDVDVFCRGAVIADVSISDPAQGGGEMRSHLSRLAGSGVTMVRIPGETVWPSEAFYDLCDELGLLVWQDCMLSSFDPPADDGFVRVFCDEVESNLLRAQAHPSVAVISGGSEIEQSATYAGLGRDQRHVEMLHRDVAKIVAKVLPGVVFVANSPIGGALNTHPRSGVAHYFGVGAYRRELTDFRMSDVRFAAECLAFAAVPERQSLRKEFGIVVPALECDDWMLGVPRDVGADWDFEQVRDHYVELLFRVGAASLRRDDPDRYLELGRATVAHLVTSAFSEWRRPASRCAGALVYTSRDSMRGPGFGLVDAIGEPKSGLYALAATCGSIAVLATDEGLSGVDLHFLNDAGEHVCGRARVRVFDIDGRLVEEADRDVAVEPHSGVTISCDDLLGGFRDLTWAYRFGRRLYDTLLVDWTANDGTLLGQCTFLLNGQARSREELGMQALVECSVDGTMNVTVTTQRLAQWVSIDVPGYRPSLSWFHLAPQQALTIGLIQLPGGGPATFRGEASVRAINAIAPVILELPS